jgi:ABC-2 type transport system permease protein
MNRKSLRKVFTVARHEFIETVCRVSFLVVTFGMPLFIGGTAFLGGLLAMRSITKTGAISAAIVDRAGVVKFDPATKEPLAAKRAEDELDALMRRRVKFARYDDLNAALDDLNGGRVTVCYVIEPDYLKTGRVTGVSSETVSLSDSSLMSERELVMLLRNAMLSGNVSDEVRERALDPVRLDRTEMTSGGAMKPESNRFSKVFRFVGPLMLCLMLWMSIFMSAGYLLQSIAQEKQNRVIEVLLSSVRPEELLVGKILGLGGAGLIQSSVYAAFLGLPVVASFASSGWRLVALSLLYVALGYWLFASLMAATGILGNSLQEANKLATVWTFASTFPAIVLAGTQDVDSWIARAMSFFPLTAPVTMLIRASYSKVAWWEVLLSTLSLLVGIWLAVRYSAKIFRVASLMYGKRPTAPEVWRWMREA